MYNSINKYGWCNHIFTICHQLSEDIDQEILDRYEVLYWESYKDCGFEMINLRFPGSRGKHTEESRKKISVSHTGKKKSDKYIENMRISRIGHRTSDETKAKMSLSKIGNKNSLGYKQSKETKRKRVESRILNKKKKQ